MERQIFVPVPSNLLTSNQVSPVNSTKSFPASVPAQPGDPDVTEVLPIS